MVHNIGSYQKHASAMASVLTAMLGEVPKEPKSSPPGFGKQFAAQWRAGRRVAREPRPITRQVLRRMEIVGKKAHFQGQPRRW